MLKEYETRSVSILACEILEGGKLSQVKGSKDRYKYEHKGKGGILTILEFDGNGHEPEAGDFIIQRTKDDVYLCPMEAFHEKYRQKGFSLG